MTFHSKQVASHVILPPNPTSTPTVGSDKQSETHHTKPATPVPGSCNRCLALQDLCRKVTTTLRETVLYTSALETAVREGCATVALQAQAAYLISLITSESESGGAPDPQTLRLYSVKTSSKREESLFNQPDPADTIEPAAMGILRSATGEQTHDQDIGLPMSSLSLSSSVPFTGPRRQSPPLASTALPPHSAPLNAENLSNLPFDPPSMPTASASSTHPATKPASVGSNTSIMSIQPSNWKGKVCVIEPFFCNF